MFNHCNVSLPQLERETIDGVRYYKIPDVDGVHKFVSITSVTSHHNKHIFEQWRQRVGEEEANRVNKQATSRGTDLHTLVEKHLLNESQLPDVQLISKHLFKIIKPEIDKINNIYALESSLYSKVLGIAGTVDCIAEYNGELSVIDFKTSKKEKPRDWIEHYFVQAAAYACMFYELTGIPVKKLVILMACEDGDCVVYEEYDKAKYIKLLSSYIKDFINSKLKEYGK